MDVKVTVISTFDSHQILLGLSLGPGLHVCYIWARNWCELTVTLTVWPLSTTLESKWLFEPTSSQMFLRFTKRRRTDVQPEKRRTVRLTDDLICLQTSSVNSSTYWIDLPGCHKWEGTTALCHLNGNKSPLMWAMIILMWSGLIYQGRWGMTDSMCSSVISFVPDSISARVKDTVCYGHGLSAEWGRTASCRDTEGDQLPESHSSNLTSSDSRDIKATLDPLPWSNNHEASFRLSQQSSHCTMELMSKPNTHAAGLEPYLRETTSPWLHLARSLPAAWPADTSPTLFSRETYGLYQPITANLSKHLL